MDKYIYDRLYSFISKLEILKFKKKHTLTDFSYLPCDYIKGNNFPNKDSEWNVFLKNDVWGGKKDAHAIFEGKIELLDGDTPADLIIETGFEGWVDCNPQLLVFVNGKIKQGADRNHTTIRFEKAGIYNILVYAYTGMWVDDLLRFKTSLYSVDLKTEKLYYDLKVPFDVLNCTDKSSREYSELLYAINEAISFLDIREPYDDNYNNSVEAALSYVENTMYPNFNKNVNSTVATIGHAHIDIAWMWQKKQTREKVQRTFSTVLSLMDKYPEFTFVSSQPILYKMVKEDAPELFERIKEKIQDGKWEVQGAMFVESDCVITGGESLIRQIIFGQKFFKNEFGKVTDVLWLPDSFGFGGQLPQIIKKSGLKFFVTSKLSWSDTQKFPFDMFSWRGIDGSEIPAYFLTGQNVDSKNAGTTYNGLLTPCMIKGTENRLQQKHISNKTLLAFGYGDGGGGPSVEFLENYNRLNKGITGCPKTEMTTTSKYFAELLDKYNENIRLPKWTGDLYLEFHRGIYTSIAKNKKNNRRAEILYRNAEMFGVVSKKLISSRFEKSCLDKGWELILENQFHDVLPGSSIKEVYEDTDKDYETINNIGESILRNALKDLESNIKTEGGVLVYNPNSFVVNGVAYLDGNPVELNDIPPMGFTVINELSEDCVVKISNKQIENNFYILEFDDNYNISRIYDKQYEREIIEKDKVGNRLVAFQDVPSCFDAWEINGSYTEKYYDVNDVSMVETFTEGISAGFIIVRKFKQSVITQKIVLYSNSRRIDFITNANWNTEHILLKALFPLNIHTDYAVCDTQFGAINRNTCRNTLFDIAKFEFCAHKYVDLSENDYGVALLNDCKYGYHVLYNEIGISCLRCPTYPNPDADKGEHSFTYSLFPHNGNYVTGKVVEEATLLNNPLLLKRVNENKRGNLPSNYSFVKTINEKLVIETIKEAEDGNGIILRLFETKNCRGKETIEFGFDAKRVYKCDLMENDECLLEIINNKSQIEFNPFEIITLRII